MSHIAVERNRRRQMNEHLKVLRSMTPCFYIKRGDQASIIGGVIEFIKEMQLVLQSLESKKRRRSISPSPGPSPKPILQPETPQSERSIISHENIGLECQLSVEELAVEVQKSFSLNLTYDILGLGDEEEGVCKGQQQTVPVVGTTMSVPLGLGYRALRSRELALEEDHVYSTFEVGQGFGSAPRSERPERVSTPPSPEWTSGSLPISPSPSIVLSPISSPMISLIVPSPIATPAMAETEGFLTELGAQVEIQGGLIHDHAVRLEDLSPALFERYDRDIGELFTRSGAVRDEIFSQKYRFRSLEHEQERVAVTFGALWRPVLALESWAGQTDT
uniref:Transcription factor MUTE n=1 Tax=Tanacetum cinerariifolium TaxID=118510 RepID=A0A6L2MXS9_TANCI|nr:transcription factor MUTE [Tanacetum cinerariifolium]